MSQNNATDIHIFEALQSSVKASSDVKASFFIVLGLGTNTLTQLVPISPFYFSLGLGTNAFTHFVPVFHLF